MAVIVRLEKKIKDQYESKIKVGGPDTLYKFVIGQGIINKNKQTCQHPELVLLDHSEAFFSFYRKDNVEINFLIGKVLRKAAHKLYRELLKSSKDEEYPVNARFLNVVK